MSKRSEESHSGPPTIEKKLIKPRASEDRQTVQVEVHRHQQKNSVTLSEERTTRSLTRGQ